MADVAYGLNEDALETGGGNELPEPESGEERYGDPEPVPGFLLSDADGKPPEQMEEEEHQKLAKKALKMWTAQDEIMSRHLAQWKVNHARRKGMVGVSVVKKSDKAQWDIYVPPGATHDSLPQVNHAADLCRKATATMFADPPAPEVEPPSGDDDDVEAAKHAERILLDIQGPSGLNEPGTARKAFDRGSTFGSGFVRYFVDPKGGGRVPIQVKAGFDLAMRQAREKTGLDPQPGERAMHVDQATHREVPRIMPGPMGEPMPMMDEMGMPMMDSEPWPEFEDRFVAPDGNLLEDEQGAAERWAPGLKREILTGRNVRFIPHTAEDLWDADGVMIGCFLAWREVKRMFPQTREFSDEKRAKLFRFKPEHADDIRPSSDSGAKPGERVKDNEDETLVFVLTIYYQAADDYPDGCYFVCLSDCYVAFRDTWTAPGSQRSLLIPMTQYAQWDEGQDNPYKIGSMQICGPGNEIRAAQIGAWFDHLERFNKPHTFIPTNSILQDKYRHLPRGHPIPINPGGEPIFEKVPEFPRDAKELFSVMTQEMDNGLGLAGTAQGLESADVKSGRHAFALISQTHAGLSELKQNIERGYVRACQVQLQLIQAFFDVPQQLRWTGEDGEHRQKSWQGADLGDTTDVRIKPGTMTLLTPAAKAQLRQSLYVEDKIMTPGEYRDAIADDLGGYVVLQDDPFRMRVERQISAWREGPEDGQAQGQPTFSVDPMTGQMIPQLGPDPRAAQIWMPVPSDTLPDVAAMRLDKIGRLMASTAYQRWPEAWRIAVDIEFANMQMAAMPPAPMDPEGGDELSPAQSADVTERAKAEAVSMGA